jgi:hypothetical protein
VPGLSIIVTAGSAPAGATALPEGFLEVEKIPDPLLTLPLELDPPPLPCLLTPCLFLSGDLLTLDPKSVPIFEFDFQLDLSLLVFPRVANAAVTSPVIGKGLRERDGN